MMFLLGFSFLAKGGNEMFLIWGTKGFEEDLGVSVNMLECPNCHNEVQTRIVNYGRKFSLFFIPLFAVQSRYAEMCPICRASREIEKSDVTALLDQV